MVKGVNDMQQIKLILNIASALTLESCDINAVQMSNSTNNNIGGTKNSFPSLKFKTNNTIANSKIKQLNKLK